MTTPTDAVHAYLTTAPSSKWLGRDVSILDHWQGDENLLWRVKGGETEAVLKLYMDAGQARSRRQQRGQELFAPAGLAPRPLWNDRHPQGLSRQVLIYEWIEGETLDLADPMQGEALAAAVAQLHRTSLEELDLFSPHPVNLAYFWRVWQASRGPILRWLSDKEVAQMERIFRQIWARVEALMQTALPLYGETQPAAIHGDLRAENVVLNRGRAVLLDWELFGLGDPAQEIARFLFLHRAEMSDDAQARWLQSYLVQSGQEEIAGRIALYRQIYPFHSLTFLLHGLLRELAADPSQAAELADSTEFLAQTITSTLQHTAETLLGEGGDEDTLFDEARRLMNQE